MIEFWRSETGIEPYPHEDEWGTYKYMTRQLSMFEDWEVLDGVIGQMNEKGA